MRVASFNNARAGGATRIVAIGAKACASGTMGALRRFSGILAAEPGPQGFVVFARVGRPGRQDNGRLHDHRRKPSPGQGDARPAALS